MDTNSQPSVIASNASPDSSNHKQKYAMIALSVVAAIGVGFGIIGTVIGMQKSNDVQNLEMQLEEKTESLGDILDSSDNFSPTEISVGEDQKLQENLATGSVPDLSQKYIYVPEWGKRYRIPDNLTSVSFYYNSADNGDQTFCVTGVKVRPGAMQYFPGFGNLFDEGYQNCLGVIMRKWNTQNNQYEFYYYHPQALYSDDEDEINWEMESTDLIHDMLTKNDEDI